MMPLHILGLGAGGSSRTLTPEYAALLEAAEVVAAPRRLLSDVHGKEIIVMAAPLEEALQSLEAACAAGKRCVVLADGDPLLYGIGATLSRRPFFAAPESLRILPGVSAMQTACARLRLPWHELSTLSLHGRNAWLPLAHACLTRRPLCIYTDAVNHPAVIAQWLQERGVDWYRMAVASLLNAPEESLEEMSIAEAASRSFKGCESVLLLPCSGKASGPLFGLDESKLEADHKLYTKAPVRAAALSLLSLRPHEILWDIGAGSGCFALEAASLLTRGQVFALEREASRVACITENRRRMGLPHLEIIHGSAPEALASLPTPDAVFLGGGLGGPRNSGTALLDVLLERLAPSGRLVVAATLLSTLHAAVDFARAHELPCTVTQIQASQSAPLAGDLMLKPINPVFLIKICKE